MGLKIPPTNSSYTSTALLILLKFQQKNVYIGQKSTFQHQRNVHSAHLISLKFQRKFLQDIRCHLPTPHKQLSKALLSFCWNFSKNIKGRTEKHLPTSKIYIYSAQLISLKFQRNVLQEIRCHLPTPQISTARKCQREDRKAPSNF